MKREITSCKWHLKHARDSAKQRAMQVQLLMCVCKCNVCQFRKQKGYFKVIKEALKSIDNGSQAC